MKYMLDFNEVRSNIQFLDRDTFGGPVSFADVSPTPGLINANFELMGNFKTLAELHKVDVLMFDPLVNLHTCSENDNALMRLVMEVFNELAKTTGTAVVLAHHTGKGSNDKARGDQDSFRGAGAIINRCRIALIVSNALEDEYRKFGVNPKQARVIRLDDAKANLYLKLEGAVAYFKWETIYLRGKETVGVPVFLDTHRAETARLLSAANFLYHYMMDRNCASISRAEAVRALIAGHPPDQGHCLEMAR